MNKIKALFLLFFDKTGCLRGWLPGRGVLSASNRTGLAPHMTLAQPHLPVGFAICGGGLVSPAGWKERT